MKLELATKLSDVEMSARAWNALALAEITTVQNLVEMSEAELWRIPNVGRITINELKKILHFGGFSLRPNGSETPPVSRLLQDVVALRSRIGDLHRVVCELCTHVKEEDSSLREHVKREAEALRKRAERTDIEMAKITNYIGQWTTTERSLEYRIQRIEEHLGLRAPLGAQIERQVVKQ